MRSIGSILAGLAMTGFIDASWAGGLVAVDQAGYMTGSPKAAYMTVTADSFRVVDAVSREVVYSDATTLSSTGDNTIGMTLWRGDFTPLRRAGEYVIVTSAGDTSQHFVIEDSVFLPVFRKSLKGFYYQRCGTVLSFNYADVFNHPACHTADAFFHSSTGATGFSLTPGGWHDAGDYGKYVVNAGISIGTLLMAYEWFPARFSRDDCQIPESGNGVPDILDEVRYELTWLLKMQRADGGVYHKLTTAAFGGLDNLMPEQDTAMRYIYQVSSTATGNFVAMMARAARVFKAFDTSFAATCLAAASKGWQFLQNHPEIVPPGGFSNPAGTGTGLYGDGNDSDERLWAAAEFFLASGDTDAHGYYRAYAGGGQVTGTMSWASVQTLAHCTYLRGVRPDLDQTLRNQIRQSLVTYCDGLLTLRDGSGFRVALAAGDYIWGSNSVALNRAILLLLAGEETGDHHYTDGALEQLHYVLGVNAHAMTFITGVGAKSPLHPHHRPSASDRVVAPVPGLLAGGPDRHLSDDPVLPLYFTASTPAALCYVDDQGSWASNEIAINWNAPLVFVAGYFSAPGSPSAVRPQGDLRDYEMQLEQNYPNPFNGKTRITFSLAEAGNVELCVVDVLGRRVARQDIGFFPAGSSAVTWDAIGSDGAPLSSGAYFFYVKGKTSSPVRKLVLEK
jgi:endoglucanase